METGAGGRKISKCPFEIRRRLGKESGLMKQEYIEPVVVVSPQEAFYAQKEPVLIENSLGKVCSEFVMCYPPGIL